MTRLYAKSDTGKSLEVTEVRTGVTEFRAELARHLVATIRVASSLQISHRLGKTHEHAHLLLDQRPMVPGQFDPELMHILGTVRVDELADSFSQFRDVAGVSGHAVLLMP
jgi:hypothetical protein